MKIRPVARPATEWRTLVAYADLHVAEAYKGKDRKKAITAASQAFPYANAVTVYCSGALVVRLEHVKGA